MKLSIRIPLLFGLVILLTSASIGIVTFQVSSGTLEETILDATQSENVINSTLLSSQINGQLDVLYEIANRIRTRSVDWDIVQPSLAPDVRRLGALDMALVSPDGIATYVLENTTSDLHDRSYIIRAMAGEKNVDVLLSRQTGAVVVMFAAPVFEAMRRMHRLSAY
jgi:methyl-accepting chemotaxis protein